MTDVTWWGLCGDDDDGHRSQQLGGSGDDEYLTPLKYVAAVRDVLGTIDLDPASCPEGQAIVKATRYLTKDDDGLQRPWNGRVFLNPPYGRGLIRPFVRKLIHEHRSGRVSEAIMLTFNTTSARWFQEAAVEASVICYTARNIAFIHRTKGPMGRSSVGSTFFYFGPNVDKFIRRFAEFGYMMRRVGPVNSTLDGWIDA